MKRQHSVDEHTIARALIDQAERGIPSDIDLWPVVRQRLFAREHATAASRYNQVGRWGQWRHATAVTALAVVAGAAGGATVVAASPRAHPASPPARATSPRAHPASHPAVAAAAGDLTITASLNGDFQSTGHFTVSPPPPFRYAELDAIPDGLTKRAYGYIPPANASGGGDNGDIAIVPENPNGTAADLSPYVPKAGPSIWFRYYAAAPGTNYLEVVEQPAGTGLPAGQAVSIKGTPATLQQQGDQTTVTVTQVGTTVTVSTNMGRDTAINGATSLSWQ